MGADMTDEEWKKLGNLAEHCERFRWLPGMLGRYGNKCRPRLTEESRVPGRLFTPGPHGTWPDFRDPATLGCLLELVRDVVAFDEVWVARDCYADSITGRSAATLRESWTVYGERSHDFVRQIASGPTPAHALVAALEAAR